MFHLKPATMFQLCKPIIATFFEKHKYCHLLKQGLTHYSNHCSLLDPSPHCFLDPSPLQTSQHFQNIIALHSCKDTGAIPRKNPSRWSWACVSHCEPLMSSWADTELNFYSLHTKLHIYSYTTDKDTRCTAGWSKQSLPWSCCPWEWQHHPQWCRTPWGWVWSCQYLSIQQSWSCNK